MMSDTFFRIPVKRIFKGSIQEKIREFMTVVEYDMFHVTIIYLIVLYDVIVIIRDVLMFLL